MAPPPPLALQGSLLAEVSSRGVAADPVGCGDGAAIVRTPLAGGAWLDHAPGWLPHSDDLFWAMVSGLAWEQPDVRMYDRVLAQPRLTAAADPSLLPGWAGGRLAEARAAVEARYGVPLTQPWCNLYRDGHDSVAWHGDRHARDRAGDSLVVIVSLGARRPFLLRPATGGTARRFDLGRGDLLVMGGSAQRTWRHCVPKVARAEPRISVTWRWVDAEAGDDDLGG